MILDRPTYLKHASWVDGSGTVAECVIRFVEQGMLFTDECYDLTVRILKSMNEADIAKLVARKPENAQFPYVAVKHAYVVRREKRISRFPKKYEFRVDLDLVTDFGGFYLRGRPRRHGSLRRVPRQDQVAVPASVVEGKME